MVGTWLDRLIQQLLAAKATAKFRPIVGNDLKNFFVYCLVYRLRDTSKFQNFGSTVDNDNTSG